jgi:hypothetical protein
MSSNSDTSIADLVAQGHTHLQIRCGCGTTLLPLADLGDRPGEVFVDGLYERLRCHRCGQHPRPGSLKGWRQSDASGFVEVYRRG